MPQAYSTFGRHVVVDVWGVPFHHLNDVNGLESLLKQAAASSGATILSTQSKSFAPQGVTVLIMLSESHLSIHTYPEAGFAAIDCYTCGKKVDPRKAIDYVLRKLNPERSSGVYIQRGEGAITTETFL
jgi:S-adenosylmethionine decarboxylase